MSEHDASPPGAVLGPTGPRPGAVVPFNARLAEEAREKWLAGDWPALAALPADALTDHPDRARLMAVAAAAALQLGDRRAGRQFAQDAAQAQCDRRFLASVLLASVHNTLARASVAAGREAQAQQHFEQALFDGRMASEQRRLAQWRLEQARVDLRHRGEHGAAKRKAGVAVVSQRAPTWIADLLGHCLAAEDVHEAIDGVIDGLGGPVDDRLRFLLAVADHFQAGGDKMTALHYLNTGAEWAADGRPETVTELAQRLVAVGQPARAADLLIELGLRSGPGGANAALSSAVLTAYRRTRAAEQARTEHGHELLLAMSRMRLPALRKAAGARALRMVEIGTTRENVPGQGSTQKLAQYCLGNAIEFVTVDMDPHNTHNARAAFERMGAPFEAVTMKGEDYLRARQEPIDLLFLDAYDFDHGMHSELRQSRYVKFIGSRIDEQACHRMHLECAESAVRLLSAAGLICVDDTWLENDAWAAKGTLAVPYLLANGFEVLEARNRAAVLARRDESGS